MKFNLWRMIAIVLALFFLLVVWYMREVNETVRKNNKLLITEKSTLEKKINDLYSQKDTLENKLAEAGKERESMVNKMAEYESSVKTFMEEAGKIKADLSAANENIHKKDSEIEALQKKIEGYEAEIAAVKVDMAKGVKGAKKNKAKANAIELPPITVTSDARKAEGKIIAIDEKYGFVVINIGKNSGVQEEDSLFVFRNKELLGRVIVEKVDNDVSVAKVLYRSLGDVVRRGDSVSY